MANKATRETRATKVDNRVTVVTNLAKASKPVPKVVKNKVDVLVPIWDRAASKVARANKVDVLVQAAKATRVAVAAIANQKAIRLDQSSRRIILGYITLICSHFIHKLPTTGCCRLLP